MDPRHYTAEDGSSFTITPTNVTRHDISTTKHVEYVIEADYGMTGPVDERGNCSGGSGGIKVTLYVTEQQFGLKGMLDGPPGRTVQHLTHMELGYCTTGMGPLFADIIDDYIAEIGIDPTLYLRAMGTGAPWPSIRDFVLSAVLVQEDRYAKMAENHVPGYDVPIAA